MFNQISCQGINDHQNQVPLGQFMDREAKWGYMTMNHCHAMAVVKRIFPNWLQNTK